MPTTTEPFALPPEDAIQWFREKGYRIRFDWRETWNEQHAAAFTVAKAMQLDILSDIRQAVDQALADGTTFQQFQSSLKPTLQKKGWWGEQEQIDPKTGEKKVVQLGSAHRLRVIYDTNLRTAHAAGKWQRIEQAARDLPYLRYVPRSAGKNRRPEHQALRDVVRPVGDPFWDVYYPPNGWGCDCTVQQLSERQLRQLGLSVSAAQPIRFTTFTNTRTGAVTQVPKGVSPGFGYNVGKGRGGIPPTGLPVIDPPGGDYVTRGRPRAADVTDRPNSPALMDRVPKGPGKTERVREHFRKVFGTSTSRQSAQVTDPTGAQVTFDERILPAHIARGSGRERYMPHAKATVEDPYEIWLVPFRRRDGTVTIRQRYIGLFRAPRGQQDALVVVEHDGAFNAYPHARIDTERVGYLHYSRDGR